MKEEEKEEEFHMETEVVAREPISFCGALSQQWLLASVRPTSAGWPAQFQSVHQD